MREDLQGPLTESVWRICAALDPNRRGVRYTTCLPSTTVVGIAGRDGDPTATDSYVRPRERQTSNLPRRAARCPAVGRNSETAGSREPHHAPANGRRNHYTINAHWRSPTRSYASRTPVRCPRSWACPRPSDGSIARGQPGDPRMLPAEGCAPAGCGGQTRTTSKRSVTSNPVLHSRVGSRPCRSSR